MTPFFMLRLWLRRAPIQNRVLTAVALALALALLVWVAVPGKSASSVVTAYSWGTAGSTSVGNQSGGTTATTSGSGQVTPGSTSAIGGASPNSAGSTVGTLSSGGSAGASGSSGASNSTTLPAGGQAGGTGGSGGTGGTGQTTSVKCTKEGSPITIGVVLPNVGVGGASVNSFLGVPPVSQQEADYSAVLDSVNSAGGVQCHPLTADFQPYDELDTSDSQTICLGFVQAHVYAALGGFGPTAPDTCLLQNKIPTIEQIMISEADAKTYYPYYMSVNGAYELVIKNFAYATAKLGYYSSAKGFKKLGVLLRTCQPSEEPALMSALAANGVTASEIDVYNFNCDSTVLADSPFEISSAELEFWQDGVTDVTSIGAGEDLQGFTDDVNREESAQHWHPQYLIPDDGTIATLSSAESAPNAGAFNGAIGITGLQYGGIAAGFPESAPTEKCDAILKAHGLPTVYNSPDNFAGNPCSLLWMLTDAMAADPGLAQTGLAPALARIGSIAMAYPDGPNQFSPGVTWGGEDWREDVFYASCKCFKAVAPNFQPSF